MKKAAKMLKMVTKYMALAACGAASFWGGYQMKEPKVIKK
ncbi:MAG: AgrD family cyclic lactone autoinducer peptide [Oscillospiraceae bacterium]